MTDVYDRLLKSPYAGFEGVLGNAREKRAQPKVSKDAIVHVQASYELYFYRQLSALIMVPEMMTYDVRVSTFGLHIAMQALETAHMRTIDEVFIPARAKEARKQLVAFGHLCAKDEKTKKLFCSDPPRKTRGELVDLLKSLAA